MLFLTCDYKEDPKHPPTQFVLVGNDKCHTINVADYPSLTDAYNAMIQHIRESYPRTVHILKSSSMDYLFMDELLVEGGKVYQVPECKTWIRVDD